MKICHNIKKYNHTVGTINHLGYTFKFKDIHAVVKLIVYMCGVKYSVAVINTVYHYSDFI